MTWIRYQKNVAYAAIDKDDVKALKRVLDAVKVQSNYRVFSNDFLPDILRYSARHNKDKATSYLLSCVRNYKDTKIRYVLGLFCDNKNKSLINEFFQQAKKRLPAHEVRRLIIGDLMEYACYSGHIEMVKFALTKGGSLDAVDGYGNSSALTWAAEAASKDIIQYILDKGAPVADVLRLYEAVLFSTSIKDLVPTIEVFLENGYPLTLSMLDSLKRDLGMDLYNHEKAAQLDDLHDKWMIRQEKCMTPSVCFPLSVKALLKKDKYNNTVLDYYGAQGRLKEVMSPKHWEGRKADFWYLYNSLPPIYKDQLDIQQVHHDFSMIAFKNTAPKGKVPIKRRPKFG